MASQHPFYRLKLIVILILVLAGAGYFAFFAFQDSGKIPRWAASWSPFAPGGKMPASDARQAGKHDLPRGQRSEKKRLLAAAGSAGTAELAFGVTIAELCTEDRCESGTYEGGEFRPAVQGKPLQRTAATGNGERIAGRVLDTDGAGLGGITLVAAPARAAAEPAGTLRFWTVTDALGAYTLDGLPEGEYTVRTRARDAYASVHIAARTGADRADIVISPRLAATAEGRVLDADGAPLPGVTVLPVLPGQASVTTDEEGRFAVPVALKPGVRNLALRFQRPGYRESTGEYDLTAGAPLEVTLYPVEAWTSVKGRLRDEEGPLAGRTMELRPASGPDYTAITDADGRFTFPAVESPADYRLIALGGVAHEDYEQLLRVTTRTPETDVLVRAYRFGAVRGHVANLAGEPVADVELLLRNTGSRAPNAVVRTDAGGNFEIAPVPAGALVVSSAAAAILADGLELAPDGKLELPLVADVGTHEIHGQVVDSRGAPVTASRIVMRWSHEADGITTRTTRRAVADAEGRFAFTRLGPGTHVLAIEAPGFPAVTVEHDVDRGYELTVQLKTDKASARTALAATE